MPAAGVVMIIVVIFGHAGAGVRRKTGILYVRSAFFHAERAKRRLDIYIILFPIAFIVRSNGATRYREKTKTS